MKNTVIPFLIFIFLLTGFSGVRAIIVQYSLEELVTRSELVVMGEVSGLQTRWNKDQEPIYTEITVKVEEVWKGKLETGTVTIEQIGGKHAETELTVPDAAVFKTGMRVVLFIDRSEDFTDLTGWYQGKFNVEDETTIQEKTGLKIPLHELKTLVSQGK